MTEEEYIEKAKQMKFMKVLRSPQDIGIYEINNITEYGIANYDDSCRYDHSTVGRNSYFYFVTEKFAKQKGYWDKTGKFIEGQES